MKKKMILNNQNEKNKSMSKSMEYKLSFIDKINIRKSKFIFNLPFPIFRNTFWNKDELDEDNEKRDLKVYYTQVRKFCAEVIRNRVKKEKSEEEKSKKEKSKEDESEEIEYEDFALIKRKYKYCSNSNNGRIYTIGFGIQSLQHNLRAFLTGDYLLDIDIKNCHPNILYKLALEYNEKHEEKLSLMFLERYCKDRTQILQDENFDKYDLLICLNSDNIKTNKKDKGFYTRNTFLLGFHKEKVKIFNALIKNTDFIHKYKIKSKNDKNPISSKINKLFCIHENKIIQSFIKSEICVPMFDGFMFDKSEKDQYDYLLEEEGLIQWDYKENIFDYDISDFDDDNSKDYESIKIKFEKECCMISTEPIIFIKQFLNEENKLEDRCFSEKSIRTESKPYQIIDENGKEKDFFDEWLKDPKRRQYNKFEFNPYVNKKSDTTLKHIYNTFNKFDAMELEEFEDPKWFKKFIFENIADENEECCEYILNYCADFVQNPFKNCEIALVLRGDGGIGKDTFINILQFMIGIKNNYVHRTTLIADILPTREGFNSDLKNKLLVQFNETAGKDGVNSKEVIKDHINRAENIIKEKYIAPYKQKNLTQIIFCSNNNSPIPFRFDERKFAMFKCGDKNKGNTKYWVELNKDFRKPGALDHLYTSLLRRDISKWHPVDSRPMTKAYNIAISNGIPHHIKWLNVLFSDNEESQEYLKIVFKNRKDFYFAKTKTVYNSFKTWCEDSHLLSEGQFKSQAFKTALLNIDGITFDKSVKFNGVTQKMVVIKRYAILNELGKYTFNITKEDEEILNFDDMEDRK